MPSRERLGQELEELTCGINVGHATVLVPRCISSAGTFWAPEVVQLGHRWFPVLDLRVSLRRATTSIFSCSLRRRTLAYKPTKWHGMFESACRSEVSQVSVAGNPFTSGFKAGPDLKHADRLTELYS